jgi:ribose/xylose/arabinose/galactoside ABC-type transport system permease subunit
MSNTEQPVNAKATRQSIGMILLKGRTFIALIILTAFFAFASDNFLTASSLLLVAKHVALYGILAIGMTYVIITGGIDLSVGSIVGLSGMLAGGLINEGLVLPLFGVKLFFNIPAIIFLVIIFGALIGLLNGVVITRFKVAPFIATLGMMYVARGLAMLRSNGMTFPNLVGKPEYHNQGFGFLGGGKILGIPVAALILLLIAVITSIVLKQTPTGWHILSIGGNEKAASLSGVKVNCIKWLVYSVSGACSAIVGLITASQLLAAHPASGESWEMNAIAAAVLGGTSMAGGVGTIGGTIVGAFVIGVLNDGMIMVGVSEFWQMVIKGVVIVFAVVIDQFQRSMQEKMALQQRNNNK